MQNLMSDIRGAMYFPASAYNAFQTWNDYDHDIAARDMGYAQSLNLNAVRFFVSYEYWLKEPGKQEKRFDDFLNVCQYGAWKMLALSPIIQILKPKNAGNGRIGPKKIKEGKNGTDSTSKYSLRFC